MALHPDYENRFSAQQACKAADITNATLLNWVSRDPPAILLTQEERESRGKGYPLTFSFNRIMQIRLTADLVKTGWLPRPAAMAAIAFTDSPDGYDGSGYRVPDEGAGGPQTLPPAVRLPGQLFPNGVTLLIAHSPNMEDGLAGRCISVQRGTPWSVIFDGDDLRHVDVVAAINVSQVWKSVRLQLGLPLDGERAA